MIGDNDAGAFSTYGQAGQNYGTHLLWTFVLLIPVLYVNQEMVLRLGAVTGVGHARLILERFGRFWGAFSVIDLFLLNALTIITEFIGITLAAGYLGVPKIIAVVLAALVIIASAMTGSFRRFERIAIAFCAGSLLLIPLYVLAHPPAGQMAAGFAVPTMPGGHRSAGHGDAPDHRDRRHDRRALAAVLPAVVCHRQADHAAVHPLREGRPGHRHRCRDRRRGGDHGRDDRGICRARPRPDTSPIPPGWPPGSRPTRARRLAPCLRWPCWTRR